VSHNITRTDRQLSDGRAIFYYDTQGQARTAVDRRPVEEKSPIGEIRHNALLDDWVVVAAHRQGRTFYPPKEMCPLCPTAADATDMLTEIPEADYEVAVFDNRFPSLTRPTTGFTFPKLVGLQDVDIEAAGKCEVVCFTPHHDVSFHQLTDKQARVVLEAWIDRTRELSKLPDIVHIAPFENRGIEIGVTLSHPHGQIYGYSYIPSATRQMENAANKHWDTTGGILLDDIVARELKDEVRIIAKNEHWIAYVPFATRYPYEIHVAPLKSVRTLVDLDVEQADAFSVVYLESLRRLDGLFNIEMPYIAAWHQAPIRDHQSNLRLHMQITCIRRSPEKLKYLAGSESAMGAWISDVTPEAAAADLKAVKL
jgi:UDPglucose--hexose-1-phosphate uridylyltransferase